MKQRKKQIFTEEKEKKIDENEFDEPQTESAIEQTQIISHQGIKMEELNKVPSSLVLLVGPVENIGKQWSLQNDQMIIGRASMSHILIREPSVSKSHAKIFVEDENIFIQDLEATNKTFINGKGLIPLAKNKLENNDQIKIGNVILKFLERGNVENISASKAFRKSLFDPLTKVYNKGAFSSQAPEEFKKARRLGMCFCLIIFDLDHFKSINDNYGHTIGDYVLKETCRVISSELIRSNDFFARFGGEEFCILLTGTSLEQAVKKAEKMRTLVQNHIFKFQDKEFSITVSFGVTDMKPEDKEWKDMFDRADSYLYQSKEGGRNKVSY